MTANISIRLYQAADWQQLWPLLKNIFASGDTYVYPPDSSESDMYRAWTQTAHALYVAETAEGQLLGCYKLLPNQPGLGSHVANAGYVVLPEARGQGIAAQLCTHSQREAVRLGYRAMQFNMVVATNLAAVHLWQKLGFHVVGRLPGAFHHQTLGYVDTLVMFKQLVR